MDIQQAESAVAHTLECFTDTPDAERTAAARGIARLLTTPGAMTFLLETLENVEGFQRRTADDVRTGLEALDDALA